MKISRAIWIPVTVLLLWLLLSWLLGGWLGLHAPALYYLRGGLSILGIIGFVGFLLLRPKPDGSGEAGVSASELDDNVSEAGKRLQAIGVKQIATLPAVFFLGDPDTAKTSVIAKSDIAQLLAGQAQEEVAIVPTRAVNLWLAKNTVLVDPAGGILADPSSRKRLFKKFSVMALQSVMGSRKLPARSVVFTVDCGTLLQKGGAEALAVKARQFQTILAELAHEMGSRFPVYVLFTKADKLSYFRDFVENLSEQEAADVLGVTLPIETHQGVYAQQQTSRVKDAFQDLYYSLADRRPAYLSLEHKPAALPNIYEFPREFGKLRPLLISFLVDLCRPSQLGISPFLRGFYFTGIRAVTVNDVAPAAVQVQQDDSGMDSGATRMFTHRERSAPLAAEVRETSARKVAQWVYLPQFLPGVILADGTANSISDSNVKLNGARRILLGAATAAALFMGIWWSVSFNNNRTLVHGALDAAQGAPTVATLDALQRLSKVKDTLQTLNYFEENGRPMSYGAFLYSGDDARDSVRKAYYGLFRRLLLAPTQERLVQVCNAPSEGQGQEYAYTALKSYLITTQYHEKSTPEFLAPALVRFWKKDQPVEEQRQHLAQDNFDFYSRELLKQNDYLPKTAPDGTAVSRCRDYLNGFGQSGRIYMAMLTDAGTGAKPIVFNTDYPGTEPTVVNHYRVEPPFTKAGFIAFDNLLKSPEKYFNGEAWVLGEKSRAALDKTKLVPELQQRYHDEFVKTWQAYLQATVVRKPSSIPDAVTKLDALAGNHSPLLLDLCVASENTAPANKDIGDVFQPVQSVTPPGCLQSLVGGGASSYMGKLLSLQQALKAIEAQKPDTYKPAQNAASDADANVTTMAYGFKGQTDDMVKKILFAPIYKVEPPTDSAPNDLAAGLCSTIAPMLRKYPFNPAATEDASIDDVNKFLKKQDGLLWKVVNNDAMKPYLVNLDDNFSASTSAAHALSPKFINFLNKSAHLAHVIYAREGGQTPGFTFTMKPVPSPEVWEHVTLKINGQIQATDAHGTGSREFEWPGNMEGVDLGLRIVGGSDLNIAQNGGLWGIWHFMDSGTEVKPNEFEWTLRLSNNQISKTPKGAPVAVRFTIDPAKAAVLRPRYFNMTCVSKALETISRQQ